MSVRDLIVIVMALELGLHYFPWRKMIGAELPRLAAYTLGLLGMMVPLSGWLMDRGEIEILQTLWIVIVAAGMTVFALYGLDHYLELEKIKIESAAREQLMATMLRDKSNVKSEQSRYSNTPCA